MSEDAPPPLTDSDHSDDESGSDMDGTSDYGSKTGNDDSDRSDSDGSSPDPPGLEPVTNTKDAKDAEELRKEGNALFNEGKYQDAVQKYKEAINAGKGNLDNKVKCCSNISHCLNRKKKYDDAVDYAFKAIEAQPDFFRVYVRCAEAFTSLGEVKLAAITLMKGEAWNQHGDLHKELMKIDSSVREDVKKYLAKHYNNSAKDVNLRKLREKGFKKDEEEEPVKKPKELPGLVASSNESSSDSSEEGMEGGKPNVKRGSPKKKRSSRQHSKTSKASSKSAEESSDDEASQKTNKKGMNKKTAELIRKEQEKEDARMKQQVEEVKRNEEEKKLAAEKKKVELEQKKKVDEVKRKEEERKKVIALNDPKETAWMNFNDTLAEASGCFMRNIANRSMEKYGEALEMIARSFKDLKFKNKNVKTCDEVVVIKFMFARACINTQSYPDIINGHTKLNDIITVHKDVRFPAVYLGFALMFKKLNRYEQALVYAEKGVDFFDKNLPCVTYNYPGIPAEPFEETKPDFLRAMFCSLRLEFKCPPKPQAICKYKNCLTVNKNHHIIPSENIYLSDPDYKGYFKVWCRSNCALDFHENCWGEKKNDYIDIVAKSSKTPTEKDFFGLTCFTPDCEGVIIKIQIFDSYGDVKTLEDKKLMEKIESEERIKKEEEKKKKDKEVKETQQRKLEERIKKAKKRKERNKSSSEKDSDSVKDDGKIEAPKVVVPANLPTVENYSKTSTPPPDIPLDQVTILKKQKEPEVEEETIDKRKHKKKERNTLHLEEFKNSEIPPAATGMPDPGDYQNRIERLAAIKKTFEERETSDKPKPAPIFANQPASYSAPKSLEEKMDKYLNPNASVFNPNPQEKISPEVIEESIKSFVFQTLKMDGPMKETDQKFTKEIGPDAKALVMERRGLINLLKSDERFASYAEYICLKGDAEKAKKMMDQDTKARGSMEKKPTVNLGDMARKIREQLEKEKDPEIKEAFEGFGLAKAAQGASILDSIKKNADIGSKGPNPESRVRNNRDLGVQTDVSSLDLDELDDPIILKQNNAALLAELQESQDKLYKIQNEKKVESKEMMDRVRALSDDKNKMKSDNNNLNETIQKMNKTYRDATKKEEELRRIKDTLESEQQKSGTMKADLNNTKLKLENEQRLSFQLQSQLQSSRDQDMTAVKSLKLRCLKTEFDGKKTFLMSKNLENEKLITYLTNMNSNEANQASFSTIKSSIDKLNEFSARLYNGIETLQAKYEEKIRLVEQSPGAVPVELNFDSSSLESPQLTSVEVDTLRLLTSVSLNTRPQVAPFASYPNTTRPPPSRPPGLLGPPPGLPPRSDTNNPLPDNLTSIRAASARPRAASSPRPGVTGAASRPTLTQAARPTPAAAGPAAAAAASGPRNKAYQKLLAQLQTRYPDLTTPDVERYIHMLRENNNGKLSGMSIQSIHERVGNYMRADRERKRVENDTDNNCSICLEDMSDRDSRRLNPCEHKFHNHCINNWLSTPGGAGNTCPMCRHYIIQEDEFPDLGHSGHRRH
eukprot:TRINITY_DN5190_c0_g1_i2.p1 TRINITY_DN5190_c0_g1~~TRINITY_DN5190_c0_g1_i2.p1  ORF type:complete len:1519 (-),score=592.62 TRINITY_DN5190_c0_g1_i2:152-4708(-)